MLSTVSHLLHHIDAHNGQPQVLARPLLQLQVLARAETFKHLEGGGAKKQKEGDAVTLGATGYAAPGVGGGGAATFSWLQPPV